jgi:protein-L-isoaspartate(D-aspartate) O-methyltransferase
MVKRLKQELEDRNISAPGVLSALGKVPRHLFVEEALKGQAYSSNALPIGYGQTISKPLAVAMMTSLLDLQPGMSILEIGTGSGYQAAVLAELGLDVFTVERIKPLFFAAKRRLTHLKYFRVKIKIDDGTLGWPENSPFQRILVTAGGPEIPLPLLEQLSDPGLMLLPLGSEKREQRLVRVRKENDKFYKQDLGPAEFVDLVGKHGW